MPRLSRDALLSLFTFKPRPSANVRWLITELGCAGSRRGRRAGRAAAALDVNTVANDASTISVVTGRRPDPVAAATVVAARRPRILTTVRRHGNLDPIKVGVFNARSVHNKHASIQRWIAERHLGIVGLSETWHDSHDCPDLIACAPSGYSYMDCPRPRTDSSAVNLSSNHGGVALLYSRRLHARRVLLPVYKSFEYVSASLQCSGFSSLALVVYRPGSSPADEPFFDDFADILERVATYSNLLIIGDINIHLDDISDTNTTKFNQLLADHDLSQHVSSPTHRQGHILDVFLTRSEQSVESLSVDQPHLSDHSQIVGALAKRLPYPHTGTRAVRRRWRDLDVDSFKRDILQSPLILDPPTNVDDLFTCYNDVLRSLVDKYAPARSVIVRRRQQSPWFDGECRDHKRNTRRLERIYRSKPTTTAYDNWHTELDKQRTLFQDKYATYWASAVAACRNDSKALWSKVNVLLRPPDASSQSNHTADEFASFFTTKVDNIRSATASAAPVTINQRHVVPFSQFAPVTVKEVTDLLSSVPSKCCSLDPLPTWLVKQLQDVLAPVICSLCNSSLQTGVMPASQKHAIVLPRLKKTTMDPDTLSSYRPISNLSFLSKFVERIAMSRFVRHAETYSLFPARQSSYRQGYSTETAIVSVHNDLVRAVDEQRVTGLVLLDLSAAFDTVDHDILLSVLAQRFGVCGTPMSWFESYLSDRSQSFHVGGMMSTPRPVSCSVPQGSSAGPIEFIAYTEDVALLFDGMHVRHHLYADDMQAYISVPATDVPRARDVLQDCIGHVTSWCASRRLQLNASKTELIWFGSRANLSKLSSEHLVLQVGADNIQPAASVRDLGVQLDSELKMTSHVSKVASVCFYHLRRLRQVRRLVGRDITAQLISAFVLSRLDYCNSVLAGLPHSTIRPLQRVLNAAARLVAGLRVHDHVTPALQQLHWLPIEFRIQYKLCLLMHLIHSNKAPQYLQDSVSTTSRSTRPGLRSADTALYVKPRTRTKFGERGFGFAGPASWNSLPTQLHSITNTATFKSKLKTELFARAYSH